MKLVVCGKNEISNPFGVFYELFVFVKLNHLVNKVIDVVHRHISYKKTGLLCRKPHPLDYLPSLAIASSVLNRQ